MQVLVQLRACVSEDEPHTGQRRSAELQPGDGRPRGMCAMVDCTDEKSITRRKHLLDLRLRCNLTCAYVFPTSTSFDVHDNIALIPAHVHPDSLDEATFFLARENHVVHV